jgi:thiosulfate dehydrogenase (quinone) large subunit
MTLPRWAADRLGPNRTAVVGRPGYLLLPLRAFLGVTFVYAGLQKLANPAYLDRHNPASVYAQMHSLQHTSPLGPLLGVSLHAPTAVGLVIALGELAVGVGTLLGLLTRVAAIGGAVLALTFFLTVSWHTTPYYYGADIVFVFAWTVLIAFGSGGVLSLDHVLRNRARRRVGAQPESAVLPIPAARLRELCVRGSRCGLDTSIGLCGRTKTCPVFAPAESTTTSRAAELDRRTALTIGAGVAGVGVATAFVAGTTAAAGRAAGGNSPTSAPSPSRNTRSGRGSVIASAASIPVGHAKSFLDPHTQQPAWLVHTDASTFVAFSAVCTHAGCSVGFDPAATQFVCPCHGGTFNAKTGQVVSGPPPLPLPKIAVQVHNGEVTTA